MQPGGQLCDNFSNPLAGTNISIDPIPDTGWSYHLARKAFKMKDLAELKSMIENLLNSGHKYDFVNFVHYYSLWDQSVEPREISSQELKEKLLGCKENFPKLLPNLPPMRYWSLMDVLDSEMIRKARNKALQLLNIDPLFPEVLISYYTCTQDGRLTMLKYVQMATGHVGQTLKTRSRYVLLVMGMFIIITVLAIMRLTG